jgi:hypothetical protein
MLKPYSIPYSKEVSLLECTINEGQLYFCKRLYIPKDELQTLLTQLAHNSVESGHPRKNKLYKLISHSYWWPRLSSNTKQFMCNCYRCLRNKTSQLQY